MNRQESTAAQATFGTKMYCNKITQRPLFELGLSEFVNIFIFLGSQKITCLENVLCFSNSQNTLIIFKLKKKTRGKYTFKNKQQ